MSHYGKIYTNCTFQDLLLLYNVISINNSNNDNNNNPPNVTRLGGINDY